MKNLIQKEQEKAIGKMLQEASSIHKVLKIKYLKTT
jgi:hypothetical protein